MYYFANIHKKGVLVHHQATGLETKTEESMVLACITPPECPLIKYSVLQ
jgi:hypothetical protein